jgi:hypothetical protein
MNPIQFSDFNFYAILVAWILHILLGLVWFGPMLFGKAWSRLTGLELKPAKPWLIPATLAHLLMVFVLAVLIKLSGADTGLYGILIACIAWAGFVVTMETGELVWEKIPFRLFLLRIGNQLIGLIVSGFILGAWQ